MNDRIKRFMDYKGLSPSEFADAIGVQRSNITHVLHGRNKPGFQFISKMLETFSEINAKWLITGEGQMLMENQSGKQFDLFSPAAPPQNPGLQTPVNPSSGQVTAQQKSSGLPSDPATPPQNPSDSLYNPATPSLNEAERPADQKTGTPQKEISQSVFPVPEILKVASTEDQKKIESIVIFYCDQTFKQYIPSN